MLILVLAQLSAPEDELHKGALNEHLFPFATSLPTTTRKSSAISCFHQLSLVLSSPILLFQSYLAFILPALPSKLCAVCIIHPIGLDFMLT